MSAAIRMAYYTSQQRYRNCTTTQWGVHAVDVFHYNVHLVPQSPGGTATGMRQSTQAALWQRQTLRGSLRTAIRAIDWQPDSLCARGASQGRRHPQRAYIRRAQ